MRKRNIGRLSVIVIVLNIIFVLVYLADRNDTNFLTENDTVRTEMTVTMDETVDTSYVILLESIIAENKYSKDELSNIRSYNWYLTDDETITNRYLIVDDNITIYTNATDYKNNVIEIINDITTKQKGK